MQDVTWAELAEREVLFDTPEVFPESWATRRSFSLYQNHSRHCSALFFVKTDIRVHFFEQNGEKVTAKKGDVVYIPQGCYYHFEAESGTPNSIDTYTVNHLLTNRDGEPILPCRHITLLCQRAEGLLDLHFQKLDEAVHGTTGKLHINSCFYALLDAVLVARTGQNDAYYAIREGAKRLREEWHKNERIETYATLCGVSNAYFYCCFRKWAGQSPVEYRNALRLSHAESMLRNTDMQIREIAEMVGFEDPFYFCRLFSKRFGVSPQKYRNGARN